MAPKPLDQRLRGVQYRLHRRRATGAQQVVGVLPLGQGGEGEAVAGAQQGQGAGGGADRRLLPRRIAIEAEDRHLDHLPQPLDLMLGQRGAERGDGIAEPGLRERDHVHIAFDHDHAAGLATGGGGAVDIVEGAALVEERGVGGVEIFGLALAQYPSAKGNGPAANIADRQHQATAEPIIGIAFLGPVAVRFGGVGVDQQARFDQHRIAIILERGAQPPATVGRIAKAEGAAGGVADAALG